MFYNRKPELINLKNLFKENKPKLIIIYGRRRVGKTELLKEFSRHCGGIYLLGRQEGVLDQLKKISFSIADYFNEESLKLSPFSNWDAVFTYLKYKLKNKRVPVLFDEFPYLVQSHPSLPSILQDYWDNYFSKTNSFFILCGSSISMMEKLLGYKSPIYGRRTEQILLEPLSFFDACSFFPEKMSINEKIVMYSVLGGTPAYLLEFDFNASLEENIKNKILDKNKFLYNDVMFVLREELTEPRYYFSILQSIAKGNTKLGSILNDFIGRCFEGIALEWMKKQEEFKSYFFGGWWDKELEIDIVGINKIHNKILFGEVKWTVLSAIDANRILSRLIEKSSFVNWQKNREETFVLIAKKVMEKENIRKKGVLVFDTDDIQSMAEIYR